MRRSYTFRFYTGARRHSPVSDTSHIYSGLRYPVAIALLTATATVVRRPGLSQSTLQANFQDLGESTSSAGPLLDQSVRDKTLKLEGGWFQRLAMRGLRRLVGHFFRVHEDRRIALRPVDGQ